MAFRSDAFIKRGILIVSSLALVCVAAAAVRADDDIPPPGLSETGPTLLDLSGRWEGPSYQLVGGRSRSDCGGKPCKLTLDVVRCRDGWCGVEVVGSEQRCGSTALKLDNGKEGSGANPFRGALELAKGTEPYVVEVYMYNDNGDGPQPDTSLQIVGDTGGEFRAFRRSFPFSATLVRAGDAVCRPDATVSLLD